MTKFLLILLLIAVIAVIGVLVARARANSDNALPPADHPDAIDPARTDETTDASPHPEIIASAMESSQPLDPEPVEQSAPPPEPEPVEQSVPAPEPEIVPETTPPVEPDPVVEPLPEPDPIVEPPPEPEPVIEPHPEPIEPEPVIEPHPEPIEPEPVVEPDTAGVGSPIGDHPAADPDEPTPPPQAVIDAGEMPAQELDPHAGWEADDDRTIHADPESGLYHTPDSPGYKIGPDGQVFETEEEAQNAGFTRWDQPGESS